MINTTKKVKTIGTLILYELLKYSNFIIPNKVILNHFNLMKVLLRLNKNTNVHNKLELNFSFNNNMTYTDINYASNSSLFITFNTNKNFWMLTIIPPIGYDITNRIELTMYANKIENGYKYADKYGFVDNSLKDNALNNALNKLEQKHYNQITELYKLLNSFRNYKDE